MESAFSNNITDFILLGFPVFHTWHWSVFGIISIMYVLTLTGNIIIITITCTDVHLHSPMYFFISNLSFIEILYTSVTIPQILVLLTGRNKIISFRSCIAQFYFFFCLGSTECFLLSVMSYDRYCAVCNPLRYKLIMSGPVCRNLVLACWIMGFFPNLIATFIIANLKFCGRNIQHFFCDLSPLLQLSCHNTNKLQTLNFFSASSIVLFSFALTLGTYICIIMTIATIPSLTGKCKAFSTCASHLTVVVIFFGAVAFVYVRPRASTNYELNKVLSIVYIVVTPVLNPLIYSFRNKDVKMGIKKIFFQQNIINPTVYIK
ncbi:olfactory receptor 6M1-like [Hyla sarda]|uniref:olfactory receptor 6M1-like n=1 Tax=Hyla sarda TaxID=327740 RepID=UPI0024C2CE6F|nr:olfactory receptor 6M1-like [Hyla sarda]